LGRLGVEIRALRGFGAEEGSLFDRFDEQVATLLFVDATEIEQEALVLEVWEGRQEGGRQFACIRWWR